MRFKEPFNSYSCSRSVSSLSYPEDVELCRNPLYWEMWGQYQQYPMPKNAADRLFFRSVLGYDLMWDKERDQAMAAAVDQHLHTWLQSEDYFMKNFEVIRDTQFAVWTWRGGVRPTIHKDGGTDKLFLKQGMTFLARFNTLDKPSHVDIEIEGNDPNVSTNCSTALRWSWDREATCFKEIRRSPVKLSKLRKANQSQES